MTDDTLSRRDFLQRAMVLGLAVSGAGAVLAGCRRGGGASEALDCTDTSGLDEAQQATRNALHYSDASQDPEKRCTNCAQWQAPAQAGSCGSCVIVPGPINPNGNCDSWTAAQPA